MIKKLRYLFTLMLLLVASVGWGDEVYYTLDGTITYGSASPYNAYAQYSEISQDGIDWKVMANTTMSPWRIGGKSITDEDRPVYSATAMGSAISKLVLSLGTGADVTINSVKLVVASDENFTDVLDEVTKTSVTLSGDNEYTPSSGTEWAAGAFYKFVFNLTITADKNKFVQLSKITFYRIPAAGQVATPTFSLAAGTYVGAQDVTISTTTEGATIYYTTDGNDPTTESDVYNGAITISQNTTLKAMAAKAGSDNSVVASAEYKIVNIEHAGTEADPYTIADARNAVDAGVGITGVYVKGIVSKIVTPFNSQYGNISFNISEDGTEESDQVEAFRCFKGANKEKFTSENDVLVNDEVVLYGDLVLYNGNTYELTEGNYVVSLVRPTSTEPSITVAQTEVSIPATGGDGTIEVTYQNIEEYDAQMVDAEGNPAEYDWIEGVLNSVGNVEYIVEANKGEARTAYLQVYSVDPENVNPVTITFTQAAYVAPVEGDKYELVKDANTLAVGDELLIAHVDAEELVAVAMSTDQKSNNRGEIEVVYNENGTLTPNSDTQIITLEGTKDAWNFNVGTGYLYAASSSSNHLKTEAEIDDNGNANAKIEIDEDGNATITFQGNNTRNILRYNATSSLFSCYASGQQDVQIYRKVKNAEGTVKVTIAEAAYDGEYYYGTMYYSDKNLIVPQSAVAETYAVVGGELRVSTSYAAGDIIPAGTAVVVKTEAAGSFEFAVTSETGKGDSGSMLYGSDESATTVAPGAGDYKFYMLSLNKNKDPESVGFYFANSTGAAFTNGAHKAYLAVPVTTQTQNIMGFPFGGDATGIDGLNVNDNVNANEVYDLQGRRMNVNNMPKGIYIVNGKKVVIK